jgi:hypothetical protein
MALKRSTLVISFGAALLICVAAWFTWQWYDNRYPTWDEEVQLSDGRVITVTQKHEYYDNYGTNQSWVTIDLPELGGKREWHSYLMPQRIDVHDGKIYLFGAPRGIRQYEYYRLPKPYLVAFQWDGKDFVRIPFLDVPVELRQQENIYPCTPQPRQSKLTLTYKAAQWCPERGDKWKFGKQINLQNYQELSLFYAGLANAKPMSN